jgi:hypothetical protein
MKGAHWLGRSYLSCSAARRNDGTAVYRLLVDAFAHYTHACALPCSLQDDQDTADGSQPHKLKHDSVRVVIVLDNCGPELLQDLRLVDVLLQLFNGSLVVELHAKCHPVFVSDALIEDVLTHIAALEGVSVNTGSTTTPAHVTYAHELASRLRGHLATGRLKLTQHPFYTSPLAFWDMPEDLRSCFSAATLCITKGDANYRRLLGDRGWDPAQTSWQAALEYWPAECGVLAVRTCKSPVLAGATEAAMARVRALDPAWLVNGSAGLMQLRTAGDGAQVE